MSSKLSSQLLFISIVQRNLHWAISWKLIFHVGNPTYVERRNAGFFARAIFLEPNASLRRLRKTEQGGHPHKQTNQLTTLPCRACARTGNKNSNYSSYTPIVEELQLTKVTIKGNFNHFSLFKRKTSLWNFEIAVSNFDEKLCCLLHSEVLVLERLFMWFVTYT